MNIIARLTDSNKKHSYDVEVKHETGIAYVSVCANTRTQAASIAKKAGYVVRSVNMYG